MLDYHPIIFPDLVPGMILCKVANFSVLLVVFRRLWYLVEPFLKLVELQMVWILYFEVKVGLKLDHDFWMYVTCME